MARINIEESVYSSDEFLSLVEKTGSRYMAIGMVVSMFKLAQKHWIEYKGVPAELWPGDMQLLIDLKFAKKEGDLIYVRGSREQFGWLEKRVSAAQKGGKMSAQTRWGAAMPDNSSPTSEINNLEVSKNNQSLSKNNPLTLTPSLTLSLTKNTKEKSVVKMHWLGEIWNEHCGELAKIKKTTSHSKNISLRVKEEPEREYWVETVKRVSQSDFLTGKNQSALFRATFSWLLAKGKDGTLNHVKVNDGNYDNREGQSHNAQAKINWFEEANLIFLACKRHGFSTPAIAEHIGDARISLVKAAGGVFRYGQMPDSQETIKALAGRLKAAHELLNKGAK